MDRYFDLAALASNGGSDSAAWVARHYRHTPYVVGLTDALALPKIDAVFLATPTRTHAALACQALEAGCHVFVEKPLALNLGDAIRAVSTAQRQALELFIGYVYLFHPGFDFLRSAARREQLRSLRFDWVRSSLSGPLHEELLCHDLAVTIALTGELPDKAVVVDCDDRYLRCRIELPSGRLCESTMRLSSDVTKRRVVEVGFTNGTAYTWHNDHLYSSDDPGGNLLVPQAEDPVSREVLAFRSAINGTRPRMIKDQRLTIGISQLLHEVARSAGA